MDHIPLPMDKASLGPYLADEESKINVVLLAGGCFNPPTIMHLRIFEMARDALNADGYRVIGAYMSAVNDAYIIIKPGLISTEHRFQMCNLACESSDLVMFDPWEVKQKTYQTTLSLLQRIETAYINHGKIPKESLKVMFLCGSDLIRSFKETKDSVREQGRAISRDYGWVCIRREWHDVEKIIDNDEILLQHKNNIIIVDELIPNTISSTRVRECIAKGLSVKYLIPDKVLEYIKEQRLYLNSNEIPPTSD